LPLASTATYTTCAVADAAKYGTVSERLHVELTAPTLIWPDLATQGKHVLVARVQYAPYHLSDGATWDAARRDALADSVTSAIDAIAPLGRRRNAPRARSSRRIGMARGPPASR